MKHSKKCPECGGTEIYTHDVATNSNAWKDNDGPDLLPRVGGIMNRPRFEIYICGSCGYYQMFVAGQWLADVKTLYARYY